ncbi:hypothetical protein HY989_02365 [Candidatus Micrarchaeota archaeon]|nr:hypothetical protein [Candidatus Micrarchaeota archaeon]
MFSIVILAVDFLGFTFSSDQIALLAFFVALISAIASLLQWRTAKKTLDFEKEKLILKTKLQFVRFPDDYQLGILFKKEQGETFTIKNDGNTDFRIHQIAFSQTDVKDRFGQPLHLRLVDAEDKKIIKPGQTMDVRIPVEDLPKGQNLEVDVKVLSSQDEFADSKIFKKKFYIPYR